MEQREKENRSTTDVDDNVILKYPNGEKMKGVNREKNRETDRETDRQKDKRDRHTN